MSEREMPNDTHTSPRSIHLREGIESFLRFSKGRLWAEATERERLRMIHNSKADDFAGDPVLTHVQDCIEELERIKSQ